MEKEWNIIEVLSHTRHDWLNRLQLIKGNLDLNRVDRAKSIIDEIIIESQQESKLTNLHMPVFASLLLRSNWENHLFQLEYEVLDNTHSPKMNELLLTNWTSLFFACLNSAIDAFQENHLSITIDTQIDGTRFFFDFSGIIKKKERIEQFLAKPSKLDWTIVVKEFSEHELALEVFIPQT
ncbi:sporulation initiation phosphotransferase B [Neobacillus sp. PS3-40]|uniref:sporulation initiation phosphotransferase B n=1 Tax=Neobacillus sp. PS3-40 TaxID=3070679 RepID=UPI0027DEBDEF|nr:sporulation initiation phosphotransferase B [Neobacillus sp. PS3-40]WML45535.1 sporulation initiation phosphotransferase B [Neobacillus sp. PS3-40]